MSKDVYVGFRTVGFGSPITKLGPVKIKIGDFTAKGIRKEATRMVVGITTVPVDVLWNGYTLSDTTMELVKLVTSSSSRFLAEFDVVERVKNFKYDWKK